MHRQLAGAGIEIGLDGHQFGMTLAVHANDLFKKCLYHGYLCRNIAMVFLFNKIRQQIQWPGFVIADTVFFAGSNINRLLQAKNQFTGGYLCLFAGGFDGPVAVSAEADACLFENSRRAKIFRHDGAYKVFF